MNVAHVEILVEEPSMEAALRLLVPRMAPGLSFEVYRHRGKQDLLQRLPERLQGYASMLPGDWRIMIVVDRDNEQCKALKRKLEDAAKKAGLRTRANQRQNWQVVNRLAIEELEAWFFGDWEAVQAAYPGVDPRLPNKAGFRDPDSIPGGTWEAFERVLQEANYFKTGLRKIESARTIAEQMDPQRNRSRSFQVLHETFKEIADP